MNEYKKADMIELHDASVVIHKVYVVSESGTNQPFKNYTFQGLIHASG